MIFFLLLIMCKRYYANAINISCIVYFIAKFIPFLLLNCKIRFICFFNIMYQVHVYFLYFSLFFSNFLILTCQTISYDSNTNDT